MLDPSTLSRLDLPPFWSPVSLKEYAALVGERPGALGFPGMPGWSLAAFSALLGGVNRIGILGWVLCPFAISEAINEGGEPFGQLHHLPTGQLIGTFTDAPLATFAAQIAAPLIDWQTLKAVRTGDLPRRFRAALEGVGFHVCITPVPGGMLPVWRRDIGELN